MCSANNNCDYEGEMWVAYGQKDAYFYCPENDQEYFNPDRLTLKVCPHCGEPDFATLS